ncbi:MAG: AfsR/SARP family transcriptional regulator [Acidimicrobiia bacterium]|nr:AfsR/SARP family transcriptional regulator [Acidimicrobiia bacterium]
MLSLLLVAGGGSVGIDQLIEDVWADKRPASARGTIHSYLSHLRGAVGDLIVRDGGAYRIEVDPENFDVARFEDRLFRARAILETEPRHGADMIREGLSLWRGDPYFGLADSRPIHDEVVRLQEVRLGAIEDCIDAELEIGEHAALVSSLEALVASHPFRERLIGQLMIALFRSGRQVEALSVYRRTAARFAEEYGLPPSAELRSLEAMVIAQSQDLQPHRRGRLSEE